MEPNTTKVMAETIPQRVYVLNGITYVPHYTKPGLFVGPGFGRQHHNVHLTSTLMALGATAEMQPLWPRPGVRL
ncbi:MAG: hypothetical protein EBT15_11370 [Betaproteobacteria bacterium]|nr:hypothetical protein [Betaproteobacteria bacterium]